MTFVPTWKFIKDKSLKSDCLRVSVLVLLLVNVFVSFPSQLSAEPSKNSSSTFLALCYHDIRPETVGNIFSVRKKDFVEQLELLKSNYNVVGLQDILEARAGRKALPEKAVLITVDDGLESFYEHAFPLLKQYKMKAVFSIVGQWTQQGFAPDYGFKEVNPKMASWKQLKEMSDSGFVDIVSHSFNLHQGHVFNPQGNQAPMAGFFKYDATTKTYESESQFSARIQKDLRTNDDLLKKHIGKALPVIVWPYGASNGLARKAATGEGLDLQLTLRAGVNSIHDLEVGRGLILSDMSIHDFSDALQTAFVNQDPLRMIRVDLDSLWESNDSDSDRNLGELLERTLDVGVNGALVQAVSTNGEAYFATKSLHQRGDYLSRTVHSLRYRSRVPQVYLRLPASVLKDASQGALLMQDLAKFTDADGVFFDFKKTDKVTNQVFDKSLQAAKNIRPHWQFGSIGPAPTTLSGFDRRILNYDEFLNFKKIDDLKKHSAWTVALPKDFKDEPDQLISLGAKNLFYDINFKTVLLDTRFRNVFSVRKKSLDQIKGEAK